MEKLPQLRINLDLLLSKIHDKDLKEYTENILDNLPHTFWTRESSLKHHSMDERGLYGNLIHTIRVARMCATLADSMNLPLMERDILVVSGILHDCIKHGLSGMDRYTNRNHPHLVRKYITDNLKIDSPWTDQICTIIEAHMGRWGEIPYPINITLEAALHIADMVVAYQTNLDMGFLE